MHTATGAPHPRSPLKRATTAPLYSRQSTDTSPDIANAAPSQEPHCSALGPSVKNSSSPQQQQLQQHGTTLPPAGLQAMQSALSRLSSQHHLSEYNRMKKGLTAPSHPMTSASSLPPTLRTNTWASASHSQSHYNVAPPRRNLEPPFVAHNQARAGHTVAALPPGLSAATYPNEGSILDPTKTNFDPPAAPLLHRSYTEEEGQNPHLHLGTSSRDSCSSITMSTPALSMDSMPPSPPTSTSQRDNLRRSSGGHSNSSALATPPDHGSPRSVSEARSSPIARKTNFDEKNDNELSERLMDAMDHSVVQVSGIPMPSRSTGNVLSGDTARIRQIQQQRADAQQNQSQRASQESGKYSSANATSQRSAPGLPLPRFHEGADHPNGRAGAFQYSTSAVRPSSTSMSGLPLSSTSASISASHSMVTQSSASSDMSRASTSLTSAHGSGMSSYGTAGMASSLSAIAHASKHETYPSDKMQEEDNLYHIHVNHPGLAGVKTSLTHPMNVSPLIPPELLPLYGQSILHAVPTPPELGHHQHAYQQRARSPLGKLTMHDMPPGSNLNNTNARPPSPTKSSSGSSAMNISRPGTPAAEEKTASNENQSEEMKKPFVIQPSADIHGLTGPNASAALFSLTLPISQHLAMSSVGNDDDDDLLDSTPMMPIKIGNLVLSSCPGKKVRLSDQHLSILGIPEICRPGTGPTMDSPLIDPRTLSKNAIIQFGLNRSPICRDLEMDFKRAISQADIKCVVCCIDDNELRFLGAAWEEYERVAGKLGLEIIRLPMAEGFAPPSPEVLDAHLSTLITKYTLQGKNCLVHCRGGVGRAGLFACSWMIKLGLLGQVINIHDPNNKSLDGELKIVEKVIDVIRKRRSAKAIETPQQVQFILQYTHWLASTGRHVTARQVLQEAAQA